MYFFMHCCVFSLLNHSTTLSMFWMLLPTLMSVLPASLTSLSPPSESWPHSALCSYSYTVYNVQHKLLGYIYITFSHMFGMGVVSLYTNWAQLEYEPFQFLKSFQLLCWFYQIYHTLPFNFVIPTFFHFTMLLLF